ncbi:unnamed protein product [Psylliodes chrysocephalus]|uniref:Uncharacterized protein n=1 Tax=Psylliodes chrysocephalus TaxID=3402493 RepID=A0A9P0GIH4_9CUCU|nr:unnamed protein product [Psylliodes chrysocephala]
MLLENEAELKREKKKKFISNIKVNEQEYPVYKNAMWAIHGITKFRVENIAKSLKSNIMPQPDMRGRHLNRPNKIPENVVRTIDDHIRSFTRRSSHYSRGKNNGRYTTCWQS